MENAAGFAFHNWMLQHELFAPSTFECHHSGRDSTTYVTPSGNHETRIDYVALPHAISFDAIESGVATDIDISGERCDHRAVLCKVTFQLIARPAPPARSRQFQPDLHDLAAQLQLHDQLATLHNSIPAVPWSTDPHTSADCLAAATTQALTQIVQPKSQWRRKMHVSDETWKIVDTKKILFKQLKALKRAKFYTVLQTCFLGWRHGITRFSVSWLPALLHDLPGWIKLHDRSAALTEQQLQAASQQAQQAIRQEDARYYQSLSQRAETTFSHEGLTGLWKHLKAVLPKNRAKRLHHPRDIDQELLAHFETLEAGTTLTQAQLQDSCLQRNHDELAQNSPHRTLQLEELPTLTELELLCLRQRPMKAPGPDGIASDVCRHGAVAIAPQLHAVVCKAFLHGIEPVSYKGGNLCTLYKGKGELDNASGYRGILLTNSYAKIVHAWARSRLLPTLLSRRTIGQIGGLPAQQTVTGIQLVKLHNVVANSKQLSTATIFVDLRSAFHHMLRELIFATSNTLLQVTLEKILDPNHFDIDQLHSDLTQLCNTEIADIPPGLRQFLHDIHHHTWFRLPLHGEEHCSHTQRGTRPGSPLADIGFNLMMADLLRELHAALMSSEVYTSGSDGLGTFVPPIAWMDDIAIPLVTSSAASLVPLVKHTIAAVHQVFKSRGLTLNLDPGKTEVLMMFRGPGAVQQRQSLFVRPAAPSITVATDTHVLTVRVVTSYKHLGARLSMNLDLDSEVATRLGAARQAFEQMKKPIFLNRHLPAACRVSLFHSLIATRLLYGCAIWSEISSASFRKLETMMTDCYRRIYNEGFWSKTRTSDRDFLQDHQLPSFRLFLAKQRLGYLQNLAKHGLTCHKTLLLEEFTHSKGWLFEVAQDLECMKATHYLPFDVPQDRAGWFSSWDSLRNHPNWRGAVQTAVRKHLVQERIAYQVRFFHNSMFEELTQHGMILYKPEIEEADLPTHEFSCSNCALKFSTAKQLWAHSLRVHGTRALESYYAPSEVCQGCLRTFFTTQRVVQHLRYRPNKCWERIYGVCQPTEPTSVHLPEHLAGVHRLPATRHHAGPLRPTAHHRERQEVRAAIEALTAEGQQGFAWWNPDLDTQLVQSFFSQFEQCLARWADASAPSEADFHNAFLHLFINAEVPEFQVARIFIHWIETDFYESIERFAGADVWSTLQQAHLSLLDDIHIWTLRCRMKHLKQRWARLELGEQRTQGPTAGACQQRKARAYPLVRDFASMECEERARKHWRMTSRPSKSIAPEQGPYYIVHLYAGRRRTDDFHHHMQRHLDGCDEVWARSVLVISIDTAIDERLMNVHSEALWSFLITAARSGRLLGLLLGPPCETWSNARYEVLLDGDGNPARGPRPLRGLHTCWGLEGLSLHELEQISVGNSLLLRGLWLCLPVALSGGAVLLEHPAPPFQEDRPAVWRTSAFVLLLREGWLFRRRTFQQWQYGSSGVKPTTVLYANTDLPAALSAYAQRHLSKPEQVLIGKSSDGSYRTAVAKEYPGQLCACFAYSIWQRIKSLRIGAADTAFEPIASELAHVSSRVDVTRHMMPDFQPLRTGC